MNNLFFKLLFFCTLLALTACNLSLPIATTTPTSEPHVIATAWTALLVGTLEKEGECIRVKAQHSDASYLLVWPADSSGTSSEDTVRVVTGLVTGNRQEVVLNVGEMVRLGGGETTHLDESLSVAANCQGPYWVVGNVGSEHLPETQPTPSTEIPNTDSLDDSGEVEVIAVSASYGEVLPEAKAETSDLVVFGVVTAVSSTKFNSDDGKQYESDSDLVLPIYTITLSVKEVLKGDQHQGDEIDITVIGTSPTDEKIGSHADHNIQVGEHIMAYLKEASLIWKDDETRPKFVFITSPESSYKVQLEDGLFYSDDDNEAPQTYKEIMADVR